MSEERFDPTPNDLLILREWIRQRPHIPQDYDDRFLSTFYRASKGRMEKAQASLESYCNAGQICPEMFSDLDPNRVTLQEHLSQIYFYEIPVVTEKDETIIGCSFRPGTIDYSQCHLLEVIRLIIIALLINIKEKPCWSPKIVFILDCKKTTLWLAKDFTPRRILFLVNSLRNGLLLRVQGIHCVNVPYVIQWIFDLMKKFAPTKIKERIIMHSKNESLEQYIPTELLPKEYEGSCSALEKLNDQWVARMMKNRGYLINEDNRNRKLDHLRPKK